MEYNQAFAKLVVRNSGGGTFPKVRGTSACYKNSWYFFHQAIYFNNTNCAA